MRRVVAAALAVMLVMGLAPGSAPAAARAEAPSASAPAGSPVDCPAPLPGPRAVVQLAFAVLLRRCPDAAGAAAWEASLRDGVPVATFARRLASTPEARGVVVGDAYALVLGRRAAPSEAAFWAGWLRPDPARTRRHDQLLAELAASPELLAAAQGSDARFVELVYERILGRPAAAADRAYWVGRLASLRGDRRALARLLLRLPEPLGATVDAAWLEVIGRTPGPEVRIQHVSRLGADGDRLGLSARLVASDAFASRAQARALVVPGRYVALGDSYVVGEGNLPFVPGDPEGCGHTTSAYPEVARTSSALVPSELDVAACSGSTLLDLYPYLDTEEGRTYPGQLGALADGPSPTLVTLTIGGNDIGFVGIVSACLQVRHRGTGQLNPYFSRPDCDDLLDRSAPDAITDLRTGVPTFPGPDGAGPQCDEPCSLPAAVADVVAAAPGAEVLVVGYPPLMPTADAGCRGPLLIEHRPVPDLEWYLAPADVRRGRQVVAELNDALRDAALAAGATYVDPAPRFAGHEVCSAEPWISGLDVSAELIPYTSTFHPARRGGVGVAAAVVDALDG